MGKVLVGINNLTSVGQPEYANHIQLFYRLGRSMPEHDFGLCNPNRMSIDRMRNFTAAAAMEGEFDYVVFIDDDVLVPFTCIAKLIKRAEAGCDVVAGVTHIRSYPYYPMIFDFSNKENHYVDDYRKKADETGLLFCDAVGFSLCLISVDLLKRIVPPFFVTGPNFTEDVYFCNKVKQQFPETKIAADITIETAHRLQPEFIMPSNVEARRNFDKLLIPSLAASKTERDRSIEYFIKLGIEFETEELTGDYPYVDFET